MCVTRLFHFRCICFKYRLIVRAAILGKNLMQLFGRLIAIGRARLFCHLDAAVRHKRALERLIRLQTDDLLEILQIFINVSRAIRRQAGNNLCLHVEHAVLCALLLLQLLQCAPQLIGRLGSVCQKSLIAVIRLVVFLDEVSYVYFFLPDTSFKTFPLFEINHGRFSFLSVRYVFLNAENANFLYKKSALPSVNNAQTVGKSAIHTPCGASTSVSCMNTVIIPMSARKVNTLFQTFSRRAAALCIFMLVSTNLFVKICSAVLSGGGAAYLHYAEKVILC